MITVTGIIVVVGMFSFLALVIGVKLGTML
jgi:hypothetical protein